MSQYFSGSPYGSSPPELRLVLLGNIGCGKTSSADTILSQFSPVLSTATYGSCQLRQGFSEGRKVTLVEAPRWYWNGGHMEDSVRKETERAIMLTAPGPHAILLLVPVGQFTELDGRVPAELKEVFGEDVLDNTMVLLTCGDYLMGKTEQDYLQKENPGLRQVIEQCGGRCHVINNRQRQRREQVSVLLEKVENMVQKNGICNPKTSQERGMEKRAKEREQELMERYRVRTENTSTIVSTRIPRTETQRNVESTADYSGILVRRRAEWVATEGRTTVNTAANGVPSEPQPHDDATNRFERTPSFKLSADGAKLSQMSEVKPAEKVITTFHHRLNSMEDRSPEASPTSSPRSPVFSSSSSYSPTFTPSSSSFSTSSSSPPELRLVLLGRAGSGKSTAGNSILGRAAFASRPESLTVITQECEKKKALVAGRRVALVDTPDWFNSEQTPDEVRAQISSCVTLSTPGPHAFLFCVPLDQPAKTDLQALKALETVFGPDAIQRHAVVLFTYADRLKASGKAGNEGLEVYIASQRKDLLRLVEKCGDRFHVLERGGGTERRNVEELLEKVEQTVKEAGGQCYSCPAFQEAENKVRQRQVEIARAKKGKTLERETLREVGQLRTEGQVLYPSMQTVKEEVGEDEIEETRDEAERSVSTMGLESLPSISVSTLNPSVFNSVWDTVGSSAKMLSSGAFYLQKMVADSALWQKMGSSAGQVSKAGGNDAPKMGSDSSTLAGSGTKAAAGSPMWEKVSSGAKMVAASSQSVGAGIGTGAKNLAKSPVWGKVGSGAKSGAQMVASSSMRLGAGIGAGAKKVAESPVWGKVGSGTKAGAKKVAESPVWGKVGSGTKAGAKMVAESPVWEKIGNTVKKVPKVVIGGAVLGLVLGVFLGGMIGGAIGAAVGTAASEVGRRKLSQKNALEKTDAVKNVERTLKDSAESMLKQGEKVLKTE